MPRPPASRLVACRSIHGQVRRFPAERLRFRVAAYGIAVREGKVLLGRSVFTGRWEPPGGAVEPWETLEEGLRREFREETGVDPQPLALLHVEESFVYFFDHPFHSLRLYFLVEVPPDALLQPDPREVDRLEWLDPQHLAPGELSDTDRQAVSRALDWGSRRESSPREPPSFGASLPPPD